MGTLLGGQYETPPLQERHEGVVSLFTLRYKQVSVSVFIT